jgi:hypothetical protein
MTEPRSDDLQRSRHEAALLLRLDPQNLSPSDALRCDLVATLRLSIDSAQADALEGRAADLGRLIVATESLVKLLPSEPPQPASRGADPRQIMWETYSGMRARAAAVFEGYDGKVAQVAALQGEVEQLKAEIERLKAGAPAPGASSGDQLPVGGNNVVTLPRPPSDGLKGRPVPLKDLPAASAAVLGDLVMVVDPSPAEPWREYVEPDGSIRATPFSGGKYWGPV